MKLFGTELHQMCQVAYQTGILAFANSVNAQPDQVGGKIFVKLLYNEDSNESKAGIDTFSDISFVKNDDRIKKMAQSSSREVIRMKTANQTRQQEFEVINLDIKTDFEPKFVTHKFYVLSPHNFPSGNQDFDFILGNDYFETINKKITLSTA